jgi:hypothetical protein
VFCSYIAPNIFFVSSTDKKTPIGLEHKIYAIADPKQLDGSKRKRNQKQKSTQRQQSANTKQHFQNFLYQTCRSDQQDLHFQLPY